LLTNILYCLTFINYKEILCDNINISIIKSARVSTYSEDQASSYETQVKYYSSYI